MSGFSRTSNELVCDGVPLSAVADAEGTPLYVYSADVLRERYRAFDRAFGEYPHRLHYALKANSTLALARLLHQAGSGADANSIWEIEVARRAGFLASEIVFTGVGKSPAELACAVPLGLKAINVESAGELARVEAVAERLGSVARVAVRINPDVDARSHPHISTGLKINKFGIPFDEATTLLVSLSGRPRLKLVAVHVHVGSQITTLEPIRRAAALAAEMAGALQREGVALEYLDLGGGLGISYDGHRVPSPEEYASALVDSVRATALPIVIEPGRAIAGPAGALVARVVDVKPRDGDSDFAVIDAGMTELLRPALYGAFHRIEAITPREASRRRYEVVGPVCESGDVVGRDRELPRLEVGDLVAIHDAGAYGSAMASNYNRRPLPAEVLIDEGRWQVIRRRQTIEDMLALETHD
ncbi:MAG: diaminopimelate decarboxylase [Acidobacteria bacterium RIFCSPLOWO2_12_FULL_65_11]|nr:MAG: diaminopimelate decarboxylase [Acidobacteria bacterium RIFCSPLOWO2_02_FULL_64_15]OFW29305.1 MAG: diaminopimelate decarboxylase [Acidobacteria bacterium RIFCSPLOWO2_12_FULL_65_11]